MSSNIKPVLQIAAGILVAALLVGFLGSMVGR